MRMQNRKSTTQPRRSSMARRILNRFSSILMTHIPHRRFSFNREHRLIFENQAPNVPKGLPELEGLNMRNDGETGKNKYAYDKVQERIDEYVKEMAKLRDQLTAAGVNFNQDELNSESA